MLGKLVLAPRQGRVPGSFVIQAFFDLALQDVYKRQALETKTMNLPNTCVQVVNLPPTYKLTVQTERLMNVTPVSYTPLDVYKRQSSFWLTHFHRRSS